MWREIRKQKGLTQKAMSEIVGCKSAMIYQYESGRRKMPIKMQIEYLKLRGTSTDLEIIKFLEETLKINANAQ